MEDFTLPNQLRRSVKPEKKQNDKDSEELELLRLKIFHKRAKVFCLYVAEDSISKKRRAFIFRCVGARDLGFRGLEERWNEKKMKLKKTMLKFF